MSQENVDALLSILGGAGITRTAGEIQHSLPTKPRALFLSRTCVIRTETSLKALIMHILAHANRNAAILE